MSKSDLWSQFDNYSTGDSDQVRYYHTSLFLKKICQNKAPMASCMDMWMHVYGITMKENPNLEYEG